MPTISRWQQYLQALKESFIKLSKLEFLNPDNSVAFSLDNNPFNKRSGAFLQDGTLNCNLQNGQRRNATINLSNLDGEFDYNVNNRWFGECVRLQMGLVLPDSSNFYLPQGVFYIKDPQEVLKPGQKTATYNLVDKWAMLDSTLGGELEGVYQVLTGVELFPAMQSILNMQRGNYPIDNVTPIFTNYYNGKTVTMPDGTVYSMTVMPHDYRCEANGNNLATVMLALNDILVSWIGYDATGALRIDPSQDDLSDLSKPIQYEFTPTQKQFLGATYTVKNSEVRNDIILMGQAQDDYTVVGGRAVNYDPSSDTNVNLIGHRYDYSEESNYFSNQQCQDKAQFLCKRKTVLQKSVSIECQQMFHLDVNNLCTIRRIDKQNSPVEKHLIQGFSIPIGQTGAMTVSGVSVVDLPIATIVPLPWE
jgi:hypothetical protein